MPNPISTQPLFSGRPALRKLVVVVDAHLLPESDTSPWTPSLVLSGLLTHEYVSCYRYADSGPLVGTATHEWTPDGSVAIGWVTLHRTEMPGDIEPVRWSDGETLTESWFHRSNLTTAERDTSSPAYQELGAETALERRVADARAAAAAQAAKADVFITDREYLLLKRSRTSRGTTICNLSDGLAIVGLYLRAQGKYIVWRTPSGKSGVNLDKGLYYAAGALDLLPASWRWSNACSQHMKASSDDQLLELSSSLQARVERALWARDSLHMALNRPQNHGTADEAMANLDIVLLLLMSAVDILAVVAHHTLAVELAPHNLAPHNAKWQPSKWIQKVRQIEPALAQVVEPGEDGLHTLTILRLLRNSIHKAALSSIALHRGSSRDTETLMRLPAADVDKLREAINALGGEQDWGIDLLLPGEIHADPGLFLESLFPRVLRLLNDLMERTPVERLPGVALNGADYPETRPDEGGPSGLFSAEQRSSVRWQLGLSLPV